MAANRYPGECRKCKREVLVGGGKLCGKRGKKWIVEHNDCADPMATEAVAAPERPIHVRLGGRDYFRNPNGRCEDAPCCGCCTI